MPVRSRRRRFLLLAALSYAALPIVPGGGRADDDSGQERAKRALERGEIRPLEEILAVVRARTPGEVVKVELERDDGTWIYELKLLTPSGRRREIKVDAATARILKVD